MTKKKAFPLRINEQVLAAMQRWADDDLRSLNAQIEYVLRDALVKSGRVKLVQKVVTEIEEKNAKPEES
ncbi:Arc family DNA-binding protein [Microbulbifer pacificus]|uniref:Arc family DNA-binding protein n=1 Tax=Microbulbifer pacificus TaxID=407164 RepID=A0AAU0N5J6_9GAMM|nr:Arc family DNA-binding protein [Microbulbifer pacificus]WOX07193.1 Arc family DNA-binding protein [Microbulbifer pacificus]